MRRNMIKDSWHSTMKYDDSGDVDQTLCKQKETGLLYM